MDRIPTSPMNPRVARVHERACMQTAITTRRNRLEALEYLAETQCDGLAAGGGIFAMESVPSHSIMDAYFGLGR